MVGKGGGCEVGDEEDKPLGEKGGGDVVGDVAVAVQYNKVKEGGDVVGDVVVSVQCTELVGSNGGEGGVGDMSVEVDEGEMVTVMAVDTAKGRIETGEDGPVAVEVKGGVAVGLHEAKRKDSVEPMTTKKDKDAVDVTVGNNIKRGETHTRGRDMKEVKGDAIDPVREGQGEIGAVGAKDENGVKGDTALEAPSGES